MALSNTHIIPEIQKLLKELEEEANKLGGDSWDDGYSRGIEYGIKKIREIIDSA
jgi:hypothetical protein